MDIFSSERVVPEQEITCVVPAQSFKNKDPTSNPPEVELVRTPPLSVATAEKTNLPELSSQYIAAFLAEPL